MSKPNVSALLLNRRYREIMGLCLLNSAVQAVSHKERLNAIMTLVLY
ncbi:MAG: hypothetical protein OWR62_06800 [Sulfobacillus thermotolerans]|nr:hypothetical protein [Sulfobacillus thermotolerans]